jgi:hypothetical protein
MTRDALTIGIDGQQALLESMDDWDRWISVSSSRNYLLRNPLIDWLERYGEAGDFVRDTDLPGYDERLEFGPFIMRKGNEFEAAIVRHLSSITSVLTIAQSRWSCGEL